MIQELLDKLRETFNLLTLFYFIFMRIRLKLTLKKWKKYKRNKEKNLIHISSFSGGNNFKIYFFKTNQLWKVLIINYQ